MLYRLAFLTKTEDTFIHRMVDKNNKEGIKLLIDHNLLTIDMLNERNEVCKKFSFGVGKHVCSVERHKQYKTFFVTQRVMTHVYIVLQTKIARNVWNY